MPVLQAWLNERAVESHAQRKREQQELMNAWSAALSEFEQAAAAMNESCDRRFVPWDLIGSRGSGVGSREVAAAVNGQPADMVSALRFGRFDFQIPAGEHEKEQREAYSLPAVLSYPQRPSLLIEAEGEGRE